MNPKVAATGQGLYLANEVFKEDGTVIRATKDWRTRVEEVEAFVDVVVELGRQL